MRFIKRPRRTRQRFLKSLMAEDFDASRALLPGYVVVDDSRRGKVRLRIVPNRSPDGFEGHAGVGDTPIIALRDAAWRWLDARTLVRSCPAAGRSEG